MDAFFGLILFAVLSGAYFAPTVVAGLRRHDQLGAVAVINCLLGWTFVGWVAAMAMAATAVRPRHPGPADPASTTGWAPWPAPAAPQGEPSEERSA